jgi:hypothetical protein
MEKVDRSENVLDLLLGLPGRLPGPLCDLGLGEGLP